MSDITLQLIGGLVITLLVGFFIGWQWSRFWYKRKLTENDNYWQDEIKRLKINPCYEEDKVHEKYQEEETYHEPEVVIDREELKANLIEELSQLNYQNQTPTKDNLQLIKGVGKVLEETLNELGVYSFIQVAAWHYDIIVKLDDYMSFPGRIQREQWVEQAQMLAKGRDTTFARRVKKGEVPTSVNK